MKRDLKTLVTLLERIEDDNLEQFIDHPLGEDIDESALVRVTSCAMLHMKQDGIGVPNFKASDDKPPTRWKAAFLLSSSRGC